MKTTMIPKSDLFNDTFKLIDSIFKLTVSSLQSAIAISQGSDQTLFISFALLKFTLFLRNPLSY